MIRRGATFGRARRRQQRSPRQAWRRACGGAAAAEGGHGVGVAASAMGRRRREASVDGPATQLQQQAKAIESSKGKLALGPWLLDRSSLYLPRMIVCVRCRDKPKSNQIYIHGDCSLPSTFCLS